MSISSYLDGPSWGFLLMNAGELSEIDPYEEVAQQGKPEHLEYHAPSDDDIQVKDQPFANDASPTAESPIYINDSDSMEEDTDADSIDYLDESEDDDEDPEKDPSHKTDIIRMRNDIPEEDMPPRRRFVLTAPLHGFDVTESSAAAARVPRGQ
uniref:Uncharacterized protein n=1 Tax=Tanacetum cinerariifolium TaxID=118510 RepID=A0A6L2N1A4_TANCI|nr:hypothetical protein [Tanacetum cinerariifolium]